MKYTQEHVEAFRADLNDYEERIAEREACLDALSGREREHLYWRLRWHRRELKVMWARHASFEEAVFAMTVLRDIKNL